MTETIFELLPDFSDYVNTAPEGISRFDATDLDSSKNYIHRKTPKQLKPCTRKPCGRILCLVLKHVPKMPHRKNTRMA